MTAWNFAQAFAILGACSLVGYLVSRCFNKKPVCAEKHIKEPEQKTEEVIYLPPRTAKSLVCFVKDRPCNLHSVGLIVPAKAMAEMENELLEAIRQSTYYFQEARDSGSKIVWMQNQLRRVLSHPFISSILSADEIKELKESAK